MEIHGIKKHYKMTGEVTASQGVASGTGVQKDKGKSGSDRATNKWTIPPVNSQGLKD